MADCAYTSASAQVFVAVQITPYLIAIFIFGASIAYCQRTKRWGKQLTLLLFNMWLTIFLLLVYIAQMALGQLRPDPWCASADLTYGTPSTAAYYCAAGATFVVVFVWWRRIPFPWSGWPLVGLVLCCPLVLAYFEFNTWTEVLCTQAIGIASTLAFFLVLDRLLLGWYPYMLNQRPWTWLQCIDTWLLSDRQHAQEERLRAIIKQRE